MGDVIGRHREDCELNFCWLDFQKSTVVVLALLLQAIFLLSHYVVSPALAASQTVTEFVVSGGPVIELQGGQRIEGHIVSLDQTNVIVLEANGTEQTMPRATVDTVLFKTITGVEISGGLVGWKPGIYELTTDEAVITVYSVAPRRPAGNDAEKVVTATIDQDQAADEALTPTKASLGDQQDNKASTNGHASKDDVDPDLNAQGGPPIELGDQVAAITSPDLEINVSTDNGQENGAAIAFDFELSKPSDKSVVLIYATIDGTAVNGEDYEPARGVLVIKAGETKARIETPVIDDDLSEDQEDLQLFLTVDPSVALVKTRKIVARIDDDD